MHVILNSSAPDALESLESDPDWATVACSESRIVATVNLLQTAIGLLRT